MTTPSPPAFLPAPPAAGTMSPGASVLVTPDIAARIINLVIKSSAFGDSLTRVNTAAGSVGFGTADPSGADWIGELQRIPDVDLGLGAVVVELRKLAGIADVSMELVSDSSFNLTGEITRILRDSLSRQLDEGILFGEGGDTGPAPQGIVAGTGSVAGEDLFSAAVTARGEITDAGGSPDRLAASGAALAAADTIRDDVGQLRYPGGIGAAVGLDIVPVPGLPVPLVYDSTRCFLAVNMPMSGVEITDQYRWRYDAWSFKVRVRAAAIVPDPAKAIRQLDIGGGITGASVHRTAMAGTARASKNAKGPVLRDEPAA